MSNKEKPSNCKPVYFWCLACNTSLGAGTTDRHGLCSSCLGTISDYDYPHMDIQYSHTNIRGGVTPTPPDPYDQ